MKLNNTGCDCRLDVGRVKKRWEEGQIFKCNNRGEAQYFEYTSKREIRLSAANQLCLHADSEMALVFLELCELKGKAAQEQIWIFTKKNQMKNPLSGKCLSVAGGNVILSKCRSTSENQSWVFIRAK